MTGPLSGIRILELAGIGPAPFCGMMLADHGAEVILIHRPEAEPDVRDPLLRSRTLLPIDLKTTAGKSALRELAKGANGLIEGFRPGVLERLGLGPDVLLADNPALVIGRMTGWGQTGPLAQVAGHDINYIAVAGVLHALGRAGEMPAHPINLVGDFGGGGMLLAFSMLAALRHAQVTGDGQVVDCAMTEGASLLMTMTWGLYANQGWRDERGVNLLDGGAHFYDSYETSDGKYVAFGAIEPQFYADFARRAGVDQDDIWIDQMNPTQWPLLKSRLTRLFRSRTRSEWCDLLEGCDACVAPVLSMSEAPDHPQSRARQSFVSVDGVKQPAPAPRYSRSPLATPVAPRRDAAQSTTQKTKGST